MLGIGHTKTIAEAWQLLQSQAALSESTEEFFNKNGPKREDDSRTHQRYYLRCKGILRCNGNNHAIFLKDISRSGMAFISPVQLFPRDHVQIWTENQRTYELEVIRCRRLQKQCYECGSIYIIG